jgi:HTH-type transcriptional repressor of NAD biosynthesis genes
MAAGIAGTAGIAAEHGGRVTAATSTAATFRHGLVIGKFYPPHAGHHFLIRSAAQTCERVTVVVMGADIESIPLELRVKWLTQLHAGWPGVSVVGVVDNLAVDYSSEAAWAGHVALVREGIARSAHGTGARTAAARRGSAAAAIDVDAVFTSEPYGAELARRFGAADVRLDGSRATYAVSGTKVRADPIAAWSALEPPVRAWFAKRVVVVGAESTGTTTLSLDLADALRARGGPHALTRWVAEYGRELTVRKLAVARAVAGVRGLPEPTVFELEWDDTDFEAVAARQCGRGGGRAGARVRHGRARHRGVAGAVPRTRHGRRAENRSRNAGAGAVHPDGSCGRRIR